MKPADSIVVGSKRFAIRFEIRDDRRLFQTGLGGREGHGVGQPAFPVAGNGWVYEPALSVVHADGNTSLDLRVMDWDQAGEATRIRMRDPEYPFEVDLCFRAIANDDVIESWTIIRHEEESEVALEAFASSSIDFGTDPWWLTQFHGDWADEAHMFEERLGYGIKVLDSKLGVRAHQFRAPWFLLSREGPAKENEGEVFGGSLAWSGSYRFSFEVLPTGQLRAGCGINPHRSTYHLAAGEVFETPKMVWAWSGSGTGELSRKLHRYVRREVLRDGERPRDILLNNWEATYFKFDEAKIVSLFQGAKDLGMELFLLDDGWFGRKYPRNDDTQGLGDWCTDPKKLPNGIGVLPQAAIDKGLRFGLWFEPEMVNPGSELFELHPDWLIRQPKREMELQRNQMVLDLTNPEVREFAFQVLHRTLAENPGITYVKWDCNRYLTQPGSSYLGKDRQSHLQIEYVRALYGIMGRLAGLHPDVEVMMCSGGGGRVDYGAMRYAHELWPSDMTDPVKRIFIQWGFSHFYPAIAVANHVTRWGKRPLKFCFDVAMSGRLGMDVDVDKLSCEERQFATAAIQAYQGIREIVQLGELYRLESPYDGPRSSLMYIYGGRAVVFVYSIGDSPTAPLDLDAIGRRGIGQARDLYTHEPVALLGTKLSIPTLGECESLVFELFLNA